MLAGSSAPAFFGTTYDEALALTDEASAYLALVDEPDDGAEASLDRLRIRSEAFRLSTRLMQVMAWLLAQRAVHEGKLSAAEMAANPQYRLGEHAICRDDSWHHHPAIPSTLAQLLDRSLNLYIRVERLDELLCSSIH